MKNCRTWNVACCSTDRKMWNWNMRQNYWRNRIGEVELLAFPYRRVCSQQLQCETRDERHTGNWKVVQEAVKGVLEKKEFVDQTIWLARGWPDHWKKHCRKAEYGWIPLCRIKWWRRWLIGQGDILLICSYWNLGTFTLKAHSCTLHMLFYKRSWNRWCFLHSDGCGNYQNSLRTDANRHEHHELGNSK